MVKKTDTQNIIDEICNKIVRQAEEFKKHKNKTNFLTNVSKLVGAWDKISKAYFDMYSIQELLKKFDKNE